MEPDFSGWATKALLKCTDGRTIMPDAFKHQDTLTVPLVWMHGHTNIENVLGHALLQNREEGVWVDAFFNKTPAAQHARESVEHGDITQMSIWANGLIQKAKNVVHGVIREVSLVLSGANPGALIQNVNIRHNDGSEDELDDEVIIFTGLAIQHSSVAAGDTVVIPDAIEKNDATEKTETDKTEVTDVNDTKQDIYDSLDDKQKQLVHSMLAKALDETGALELGDEEETPQETYDSMNDKQKEMVHSMLAEALEQGELSHADEDATVGDIYDAMSEEKKQLVHFMIGQAISGDTDELEQSDMTLEHADGAKTVKDVYDSMTEVEKQVLHFMVGEALEAAAEDAKHSGIDSNDDTNNDDKEGTIVKHNVFEDGDTKTKAQPQVLSHDAMQSILDEAREGGSFKAAMEGYALSHGINDIEVLFPDAQAIDAVPEFLQRRTEWVSVFLGGSRKVPFSRIKSFSADLTEPEARAKGYIKGELKREEFFKVARRATLPTTIYKKQKLDRDDLVDITDFDIVAWLKGEMRMMLDEEIARAGLLGDNRAVDDPDKVDEDCIRPVVSDHELYAIKVYVNLGDSNSSIDEVADAIIRERSQYKGSGNPVLFTTETIISRFLILKDQVGRRIYKDLAELQTVLRVSKIVPVEVMEEYPDVIGVLVNPADYTYGATRGGEVSNFEDFDIDFNQYKYLCETRCSGTLTKLKSAMVLIRTADNAVQVNPAAPTFDAATGELIINDTTGVVYKNQAGTTLTNAGGPYDVPSGETWTITATPGSSAYYISDSSADDGWDYTAD